jgi:fatty-acyl-CoA synthase
MAYRLADSGSRRASVDVGGNAASPLKAWLRALELTAPIGRASSLIFPSVIENLAGQFGDKSALVSCGERLSYRGLAQRSSQYARWALAQGISAGDVVCLLMANCPEYMATWLGLTRARGVVSLLNTNLSGEPLVHAINAVAPKHLIVGTELADSIAAVLPRLSPLLRCWVYGESPQSFPRIDEQLKSYPRDDLAEAECSLPSISDPALYIYTSGTTGLPKAANVSHFRIMQWSHWFAGMMGTNPDDVMYDCLPMYHSVGGVVATGATLVGGGTVVVWRGFSTTRFWNDVVESKCTLVQYIGELCRYLVNSPFHPLESEHRLRLCCGNGLGLEVWNKFKDRFRIPAILEFYAATEANFSLCNCEGKPGAVGRVPPFLAHRFPVALVQFDFETNEPLRHEMEGFCIPCSNNEVGEAIGRISEDRTDPGTRFEGYADREASEKKVLRDVFVKGDTWYRTGDLMRRDENGYYYFVDRVGDTFRWKGENVSTTEVAGIICACPGVAGAVVYGVTVPGNEGRAGMAAISIDESFDLREFRARLSRSLADYARPLFLRIRDEIAVTGTFKPDRRELVREGYNPAEITDLMYFDDRFNGTYIVLDSILYRKIISGGVRI